MLFEIRHLKGLKSNFGIVDRKVCLLHLISYEDQPLSHAIITNPKALVEAQYFLFQTLWNQAIPAQEKIREIEEDIKPPFIETLRDPNEIRKLVFDLVNSAKQEILMLLFSPTTAAGNELREEEEHAHGTIELSISCTICTPFCYCLLDAPSKEAVEKHHENMDSSLNGLQK